MASEVPSGAGWREAGKQARRRRIIAAAATLARSQGFEAVAMTAIAAEAGVSPATLYNLFETKSAIFGAVFDQDLEAFERLLAASPAASAIDRIFAAVELAGQLYASDPVFYRAMAFHGGRGDSLRPAIREPRMAFWQARVAAAIADRGLRNDSDPVLIGTTLAHMLAGVVQDWAADAIDAQRLVLEASFGFALILIPCASAAGAPGLRERLAVLRNRLAERPRTARTGVPPR